MADKKLERELINLLTTLNKFGMITGIPTEVLSINLSRTYGKEYLDGKCFLTLKFKVKDPNGENSYTLIESGNPENHEVYRLMHPTGFEFTIYMARGGRPRDVPMYAAVDDILTNIETLFRKRIRHILK